jgi:hypothetical protein
MVEKGKGLLLSVAAPEPLVLLQCSMGRILGAIDPIASQFGAAQHF